MDLKEAQQGKNWVRNLLEEKFVQAQGSSDYDYYPGIGIHPTGKEDEFQIAIHLVDESQTEQIRPIVSEIGQEKVNVQVTGLVHAYNDFDQESFSHSLKIGASISRDKVNAQAGTLGCFVKKINDPFSLMILSNTHILHDMRNGTFKQQLENPILLPATKDGGNFERDIIATLEHFDERFIQAIHNQALNQVNHELPIVDAAIARLNYTDGTQINNQIHDGSYLKGIRDSAFLAINSRKKEYRVSKIGRVTKLTHGNIKSLSIAQPVHYELLITDPPQVRSHTFSNLMTIEGIDNTKFSNKGDSGSLIYDQDGYAVALLLGGTRKGVTFAVPIEDVFKVLNICLP